MGLWAYCEILVEYLLIWTEMVEVAAYNETASN
jgi:hypothetical protein